MSANHWYEIGWAFGFDRGDRTNGELLTTLLAKVGREPITDTERRSLVLGIADGRDDWERLQRDADAMAAAWDQQRLAEVSG